MILLDEKPEDELHICHPPTTLWQLQASLRRLARAQAMMWHAASAADKQKYLQQAKESE